LLLREGHNCWKKVRADRVAFLIDAEAYFDRLVSSLERARRSILMVGWDFHSRTPLRRGKDVDEERFRLGPLLDRLARDNRGLHVKVLAWDFAMIYATERELLQRYRFGWRTHRRVRFALDGNHPLGASHHQKLVVVDDSVAFAGGLDLTMRRWDTSGHVPESPLRTDPDGKPYAPFHDVQLAVSGPAARALGELARERWRRATGRRLRPAEADEEVWPDGLTADLENASCGIARTEPAYDGRAEVREIARLYDDALAAARRYVLLENQYATAGTIAARLAERLAEGDGPEVLLINPKRTSGWLEDLSMGTLREKFLERLRRADDGGRLRACYPRREGLGQDWIKVHSKICIVDDRFATVGSANLANRSMGLDTECNVAIEVEDEAGRQGIRRFRDRLLGEHLGVDSRSVTEHIERSGSLLRTVDSLGSDGRSLEPLPEGEYGTEWLDRLPVDGQLLDPERPVDAGRLLRELGTGAESRPSRQRPWRWVAALAAAVLLALAWRYGPLSDWASSERIVALITDYRTSPFAFPLTVALFMLGGLVLYPVTLLIAQTAAVFGPLEGFAYALAGALASAAATFLVGRMLGDSVIRRVAGPRFGRIVRFLARRGTLSVAAVRLVPVAPFGVVNMGAGAAGIRFGQFLLGTLLGMLPGTLALTVLGDRAAAAVRNPGWTTVLVAIALAATLLGLGRYASTWMRRSSGR